MSYWSYMSYRVAFQSAHQLISQSAGWRYCRPLSYRVVLWHVADVPGVQGKVEVWKLGCLEVWKFGFLVVQLNYFACRPLVGRSVLRGRGRFGPLGLHALFSVLQGAKAPFPCRGVGQRPIPSNQPIS